MGKKTVICVDDEKIVLDSLKKELKNALGSDFNIEIVESGVEALELFNELHNDNIEIPIVISDYIMPDMKGDEVLKQIKSVNPKVYNIMLTGQATIEGVTNAINKAGLYRYIAKPWETHDLILTVLEAVKSYQKDVELEKRRKELEEANEKLIKLDQAKSYFLGLLSHELNTPLIGINGNAKLIKEITDDADIKESAEAILESEAKLRKFAELSLLITRIQTNKYETTFYEEKLFDTLDASLSNFKIQFEKNKIKIEKNYSCEDKFYKMDSSLICKTFDIIIDNCLKFSKENSKINISANKVENSIYMIIRDHGIGFSEKSVENLFQPFSADELMSHSEGTGLSLAAAKVIMELHNFKISAKNAIDGGAEIHLVF